MDLTGVKVRVPTKISPPVNKMIYSYGAVLEVDGHNVGVIFENDDVEWIPKDKLEYQTEHGNWEKVNDL